MPTSGYRPRTFPSIRRQLLDLAATYQRDGAALRKRGLPSKRLLEGQLTLWPTIGFNDTSSINPMLRRRPSDCPRSKDEDACSDEAGDQIAEHTATKRDAEHVE